MKKVLLAIAFCIVSVALCARSFEIAVWRGETRNAIVEDFAEIGEPPQGITLKVGSLKSVKYAPQPNALERLEKLDRVVWGDNSSGYRVVEISVDKDMMPGTYEIGALVVRVIDRVLPPASQWKNYLDLWQHPFAVARVADVKPFSREHYRAMKSVWELLATAGQKSLTVPILDEPWDHQCYDAYYSLIKRVKKDDGTWSFDYRIFDEYVEFGRKCGIGPDISCYTMCPWGYIVRYQNEKGETQKIKACPGTREFDEFWEPFLKDFSKHLKEKGWFKDIYIAMDERSPEDVLYIAKFIQKHAPGMRISMAGNRKPSDFDGIVIDNYSQILNHVTAGFLSEVASRREKGFVTTFYVCCWPLYPNTFISSGRGEAFWLGAYPGVCGLDGFLRWAWNSWPHDPVKDASYWVWAAGDTYLCYPNGEPSWRFLALRNGIVAGEKIRILKSLGLFEKEFEALNKLYDISKAVSGKADYAAIEAATMKLVNQ
jgi:hypothetical protein